MYNEELGNFAPLMSSCVEPLELPLLVHLKAYSYVTWIYLYTWISLLVIIYTRRRSQQVIEAPRFFDLFTLIIDLNSNYFTWSIGPPNSC